MAQIGVDVDFECHIKVLEFLEHLDHCDKRIAVDNRHLIFGEYFRLLSQQLAPYDLLTRLMAQGRVLERAVAVADGVACLPNDLERLVHDRDDRKFVAVALSFSSPPPVVNATDSDWVDWERGLRDHGIEVIQLCPELVNTPRGTSEQSV